MRGLGWQHLASAARDLLYPPHCAGCENLLPPGSTGLSSRLCVDCQGDLWPCRPPACQVCGESFLPEAGPPFTCQTCAGRRFAFAFALSPYQSRGVLRELIHRFKYQRQTYLRPLLGTLLAEALSDPRVRSLPRGWLCVPVPLHPRRFREREFNQALELCRELSLHHGVPFCQALRRTRYTSSQTRFHRRHRLANLRGAFIVRPRAARRLQGRTIALVDDVFTTGSTAHECSRILRQAGAKKVVVITLARG